MNRHIHILIRNKSMKIVFLLCLFVCPLIGKTQFIHKVKADTLLVTNDSCSAELVLKNSTKNISGVLFNKGNGVTEFRPIGINRNSNGVWFVLGSDSAELGQGSGGVSYAGDPDVRLSREKLTAGQMRLDWWKSTQEFYNSPRIGVIGDSQGKGEFATSYSQSIMGRLQQFVYGITSNAGFTNYCQNGYNSRRLAPTGSNAFVDNNFNVTKALSDGNKIIILCNTSNDFSTSGAGGYTPVEEFMNNTLLIAEACEKAGATLFVVSPLPRNEYSQAVRDSMRVVAGLLQQKFGDRYAYVYHMVEDSLNETKLAPAYETGDGIHLNNTGSSIVFSVLRDVLASYYTSNPNIKNYQLHRASSYSGDYLKYATITNINQPTLQIPEDSLYYKVRISYRNGYYSKWSNVIQGSLAQTGGVTHLRPIVSATSPVVIYLPTNSSTLTVTAADANPGGSITSYNWVKIYGGAATVSSPTSASSSVSGLQEGGYLFRCQVTNALGLSSYGDVQLVVRSYDSSVTISRFNFNVAAGPVDGWVDVGDGPFHASNNGKVWTDNVNNRSIVNISNSEAAWGANYYNNAADANGETVADPGGFAIPPAVLRTSWYSYNRTYVNSGSNQLKFTNLNPTKSYKIKLYGSLATSIALDADPTIYIVNNNTLDPRRINAVANTSNLALFRNVFPNSSGEIPFFVGVPAGEALFGLINAATIEEDQLSAVNEVPQVTVGSAMNITLPLNTVTLSASAIDPDGSVMSILWTQVSGPATASITSANTWNPFISLSSSAAGTYTFRCSVTDDRGGTGSADVNVVVNNASSNPTMYVGVTRDTYTASPWLVLAGTPSSGVVSGTTTFSGNTVTVSTVNTSNWVALFGFATSDSTGEVINDGNGFVAPLRVHKGAFFNLNSYDVSKPQVEVTGLPAGTYKVRLFGSLQTATANSMGIDCNTVFRVNGSSPQTINAKGNTSQTADFTGIVLGSGDPLKLYFNPTTANSNNWVGMLNFFIVERTGP
jgi:lysophospholipase L1-like esterase